MKNAPPTKDANFERRKELQKRVTATIKRFSAGTRLDRDQAYDRKPSAKLTDE